MRLICVAIAQKSVWQAGSAQGRIVVCAKPQTFGDGKTRVRRIFSQNKTFTKRSKNGNLSPPKRRNKDKEQKIMKKSLVISTIATVLARPCSLSSWLSPLRPLRGSRQVLFRKQAQHLRCRLQAVRSKSHLGIRWEILGLRHLGLKAALCLSVHTRNLMNLISMHQMALRQILPIRL